MPKLDPRTCPHNNVSPEVVGMQKSGDYICQDCGEMLYPEDMKQRREAREAKQPKK